jgi:hypothetical protein
MRRSARRRDRSEDGDEDEAACPRRCASVPRPVHDPAATCPVDGHRTLLRGCGRGREGGSRDSELFDAAGDRTGGSHHGARHQQLRGSASGEQCTHHAGRGTGSDEVDTLDAHEETSGHDGGDAACTTAHLAGQTRRCTRRLPHRGAVGLAAQVQDEEEQEAGKGNQSCAGRGGGGVVVPVGRHPVHGQVGVLGSSERQCLGQQPPEDPERCAEEPREQWSRSWSRHAAPGLEPAGSRVTGERGEGRGWHRRSPLTGPGPAGRTTS